MTVEASPQASPFGPPRAPVFARYLASGGRLVVSGTVQHGDERGRELGFPTANLALDGAAARDGVWAGTVTLEGGQAYAAAVSVGRRTTFYGRHGVRLLEAHLLDFSGDLYGQRISVELRHLVRPQRRFSDIGALAEQIDRDVADARAWAASHLGGTGGR
jgi:riboflavin kinase/FMN adenylyltransferase